MALRAALFDAFAQRIVTRRGRYGVAKSGGRFPGARRPIPLCLSMKMHARHWPLTVMAGERPMGVKLGWTSVLVLGWTSVLVMVCGGAPSTSLPTRERHGRPAIPAFVWTGSANRGLRGFARQDVESKRGRHFLPSRCRRGLPGYSVVKADWLADTALSRRDA